MMKVCDVVLNSIWCDPRVRKQINAYMSCEDVELSCVGLKCQRYDEQKVKDIPCHVDFAEIDPRYKGRQRNPIKKILREKKINDAITNAIIAQGPDVIHANDLNALIPAYKAAKKLKCKLVYDSHEIWVENFFQQKKRLYAAYLKAKERHIVKRIDKMVCVSHAAAEHFAKTYNIEQPMVVTNCSLKSEQHISSAKNAGFEAINHGQFYAGRGYDVMLEAAPYLKDYPEIKLAIRGYGYLEKQLRERKEELGADNYIFYPPVHVKDLISSASLSHVGVAITEAICLNFKLSVSNKIFEYASAGLPVIMSDIPEHRYLNGKYNFGIVLEEDTPKAFADALIKLYTDKELYNEYSKNAVRLSDEVNWENEFYRLVEFERKILS